MIRIALYSVVIFFLLGCYEAEEGCLDPLAKNYDVSADEPGPCNYPDLILDLSQVYDTLIFVPGRAFNATGVDSIKIDTLHSILSGFMLTNVEDQKKLVTDTRTIEVDRGMGMMTVSVTDDVVAFRSSRSRVTVGSFPQPGMYDSLRFQTGLNGEWMGVLYDQLPERHPLNNVPKIAPDSSARAWGYLSVRTFKDNTKQRFRARLNFDNPELVFSRSDALVVDAGEDAEIELEFDYAAWIQSIDWANDSDGKIISTLEDQFTGSFEWIDE